MGAKELLAAFFIAVVTNATATGADVERVGPLGRPDMFVVVGPKAFSPGEIRDALFNELDVVAASEPNAPLADFVTVIAEKAAAGYRSAGFFDVDVSVTVADGKLWTRIHEGEQFANGEISVAGNRRIDAEKMKADLTEWKTRELRPRPLWRTTEAASFGPESEARLTLRALESVNDQGFYWTRLKAKVEPDRSAKRATLSIEISDEGQLSALSDVAFAGNERDSREALIDYLALDASAPLTRELRHRIERQLLDSGRFVQVHWELGEPEERNASWRPRLALQEYEQAPPLDAPLSREEAALLKLAEWFRRFEESDEEILFQSGGETFLVFSPQRGFVVSVKESLDDAAASDRQGFDYAIVMDEKRVGLYSSSQRRKAVAEPPPSPVTGEAVLRVIGGPPKWASQGEIKLGAGLSTETHKGYRRHMKVRVELTAAAALSVLRKHKASCRWDGDVLCLEWDNCRLRANALTGQLVEYVIKAKSSAGGNDAEISTVRVVQPGEFERQLRKLDGVSADWPNVADPLRPLTCLGEFLCCEMQRFAAELERYAGHRLGDLNEEDDDPRWTELQKEVHEELAASFREHCLRKRRGYAALRKAISLGMLEPFDELMCQAMRRPVERFSIPSPLFHLRARSLDEFRSAAWELAPIFGVRIGNFLFPVDGWMNAAWRQGLLAVAENRTALLARLQTVMHHKIGPLSGLATAELLRSCDADFESSMYAIQGSRNRSAVAFRDECRELVKGEGFASQVLLKTAAAIRQLDATDIESLAGLLVEFEMLSETQAAAIEFAALRGREEDSSAQAAAEALNALWRVGFSAWIERRLNELINLPEKPAER